MVQVAGTLLVSFTGYSCRPEFAAVGSRPEHRVVHARTLDVRQERVWTLEVERVREAEVQHVVDLWRASGRGALPVDWENPDGETLPHYLESFRLELEQPNAVDTTMRLELRERVT